MKAILFTALLFSSAAVAADQMDDVDAIGYAIAMLVRPPYNGARFTNDGDAASDLERMRNSHSLGFRIVGPPVTMDLCPPFTISHLPWGEFRVMCPTVANQSIVFVTPDVALAEGAFTYEENGTPQSTPLLFVMRKDGDYWKIAFVRVLSR